MIDSADVFVTACLAAPLLVLNILAVSELVGFLARALGFA